MQKNANETPFPQSTPFWRGDTWGHAISHNCECQSGGTTDHVIAKSIETGRLWLVNLSGRRDPNLKMVIPKRFEAFTLAKMDKASIKPKEFAGKRPPWTHYSEFPA